MVAHALAKAGIKNIYGVIGIPVTELASAAQVTPPPPEICFKQGPNFADCLSCLLTSQGYCPNQLPFPALWLVPSHLLLSTSFTLPSTQGGPQRLSLRVQLWCGLVLRVRLLTEVNGCRL